MTPLQIHTHTHTHTHACTCTLPPYKRPRYKAKCTHTIHKCTHNKYMTLSQESMTMSFFKMSWLCTLALSHVHTCTHICAHMYRVVMHCRISFQWTGNKWSTLQRHTASTTLWSNSMPPLPPNLFLKSQKPACRSTSIQDIIKLKSNKAYCMLLCTAIRDTDYLGRHAAVIRVYAVCNMYIVEQSSTLISIGNSTVYCGIWD